METAIFAVRESLRVNEAVLDSLIAMKARFDGRLKYYAVTNLSRQDYALVKGLGDDDVKVQHRWDFESIQGGAFFWNDDRGGFDAENGEYIGDEAVYRLIGEASRGFGEGLANDHIRSFECLQQLQQASPYT